MNVIAGYGHYRPCARRVGDVAEGFEALVRQTVTVVMEQTGHWGTFLWYNGGVPLKRRLRKTVDDESLIWCAAGSGVLREEVWVNDNGTVVRYNLAFINHFMTHKDNGRVLGYDNAHGEHHRHFYGTVELFPYTEYDELSNSFYKEVAGLRQEMK